MSSPTTEANDVLAEQPISVPDPLIPVSEAAVGPRNEHSLYVKNVPVSAWEQARHNAISSHLSFRDYIIRVLFDCKPYPRDGMDHRGGLLGSNAVRLGDGQRPA